MSGEEAAIQGDKVLSTLPFPVRLNNLSVFFSSMFPVQRMSNAVPEPVSVQYHLWRVSLINFILSPHHSSSLVLQVPHGRCQAYLEEVITPPFMVEPSM